MLPPVTFYAFLDLLGLTDPLIEFKNQFEFPYSKNISELNRQFINYLNYGGFPNVSDTYNHCGSDLKY